MSAKHTNALGGMQSTAPYKDRARLTVEQLASEGQAREAKDIIAAIATIRRKSSVLDSSDEDEDGEVQALKATPSQRAVRSPSRSRASPRRSVLRTEDIAAVTGKARFFSSSSDEDEDDGVQATPAPRHALATRSNETQSQQPAKQSQVAVRSPSRSRASPRRSVLRTADNATVHFSAASFDLDERDGVQATPTARHALAARSNETQSQQPASRQATKATPSQVALQSSSRRHLSSSSDAAPSPRQTPPSRAYAAVPEERTAAGAGMRSAMSGAVAASTHLLLSARKRTEAAQSKREAEQAEEEEMQLLEEELKNRGRSDLLSAARNEATQQDAELAEVQESEAEQDWLAAKEHAATDDWEQAIQSLNSALAHRHPRADMCYHARGVARDHLGQHRSSLGDLSTAAHLDPHNHLALYHFGQKQWQLGELVASVQTFQACVELQPHNLQYSHDLQFVQDALHAVQTGNGRLMWCAEPAILRLDSALDSEVVGTLTPEEAVIVLETVQMATCTAAGRRRMLLRVRCRPWLSDESRVPLHGAWASVVSLDGVQLLVDEVGHNERLQQQQARSDWANDGGDQGSMLSLEPWKTEDDVQWLEAEQGSDPESWYPDSESSWYPDSESSWHSSEFSTGRDSASDSVERDSEF